jgi:hypothetical protein
MAKYNVNRKNSLTTSEKTKVERCLYNKKDDFTVEDETVTAEEIAKELDLDLTATQSYLEEKLDKNGEEYVVESLQDRYPDAEYIVVDVEAGRHISTKQRYILDCLRDDVEIHTTDRCGSLSFSVYNGEHSESYSVDGTVETMDWIGTLRNLPEWIEFEHDLIDDFNTNVDERRLQLRDDPLTLEDEVRAFIEQNNEPTVEKLASTDWVEFIEEDEQRLFTISDAPYDDYETIDSVVMQWCSCRPLEYEKYDETTERMDSVILEYLDGDVDADTAWRQLSDLHRAYFENKDYTIDLESVEGI